MAFTKPKVPKHIHLPAIEMPVGFFLKICQVY